MKESKPLGKWDKSGFEFAQEMLHGDVTAAINFDRIQKHPKLGYILFEFLLCEESQSVSPFTSHPRRYWNKNSRKFIALWQIAQDLHATLYLVNYAKSGTRHDDEILVIEVLALDETGIREERQRRYTRREFSDWFRALNSACL